MLAACAGLFGRVPRLLLIVAAMAAGYSLRSFPNAASPFRHTSQAEAEGDAHGFGPALDHATSGRVPGEFEKKEAILLGVNELLEYHPETLVEIVAALGPQTGIIGLISKPDQERQTVELLRSRGLATDTIRFFLWPAASMWVQDFGPRIVVAEEPHVVDFEYKVVDREAENQLPMAFAAEFGMKIAHCHLVMEGGNCLSNGRGLCVSSTTLISRNQEHGRDLQAIGASLKRYFGFRTWSYLRPIIGETTGHIDLFLNFGGPHTVFLAAYDPEEDRDNAVQMDANAGTLADIITADGMPLEIIRIRQPPARDGLWRSYTNVIYGNDVVLVPQFPDFSPELDRQALEIYRRAFPERRVVGIDSSTIIAKRGGLHCLALSIPELPDRQ